MTVYRAGKEALRSGKNEGTEAGSFQGRPLPGQALPGQALPGQARQAVETGELVRLAEVYGLGCTRLLRLLRAARAEAGQLEEYLREVIDQALEEATREMGIGI